ncbi:zinc ribbon domain-containing protein [Sporolactobacillus sp. STCC-11]|uniref:zinc ribbon domain-containing protein n=1 Tax=Sporolactobacillus caesalpiniae TaxID=3230362 RepID=UPI00339103CC
MNTNVCAVIKLGIACTHKKPWHNKVLQPRQLADFKNVQEDDDGKHEPGVREWTCPHCGMHHDRDVNAAKNSLNRAIAY